MKINPNIDLTYCTNIHFGECWYEHFNELQQNIHEIKSTVCPEKPMAIGLRLSNKAAHQLEEEEKELELFKEWLFKNNLYVPTINGFPYGSFHNKVVKDNVHTPDWLTQERVDYTILLAQLLSNWVPANTEGSISTSPGTYKYWHKNTNDIKAVIASNFWTVIIELERIYETTGILIHLDPEPEPDGLIESGNEFIAFYNDYLIKKAVKEKGLEGLNTLKRHLRLCLDVCHFAVEFEDIRTTFSNFIQNDIPIGKIQLSSALKANLSSDMNERFHVIEQLRKYEEPTYLHQVVQRNRDNSFTKYRDLSEAMYFWNNAEAQEWRIHFHVPIFTESYSQLLSTRSSIVDTLQMCNEYDYKGTLEIETYTWDVLPDKTKPKLKDCIVKEIKWVENEWNKLVIDNKQLIIDK